MRYEIIMLLVRLVREGYILSSELIKHISRKDFIRFQNELLLKLGV